MPGVTAVRDTISARAGPTHQLSFDPWLAPKTSPRDIAPWWARATSADLRTSSDEPCIEMCAPSAFQESSIARVTCPAEEPRQEYRRVSWPNLSRKRGHAGSEEICVRWRLSLTRNSKTNIAKTDNRAGPCPLHGSVRFWGLRKTYAGTLHSKWVGFPRRVPDSANDAVSVARCGSTQTVRRTTGESTWYRYLAPHMIGAPGRQPSDWTKVRPGMDGCAIFGHRELRINPRCPCDSGMLVTGAAGSVPADERCCGPMHHHPHNTKLDGPTPHA